MNVRSVLANDSLDVSDPDRQPVAAAFGDAALDTGVALMPCQALPRGCASA